MEELTYNKNYIYFHGMAIISDTNGNLKTTDYYDNLGQVLSIENKIKYMEKKKEEFQSLLDSIPEAKKRSKHVMLSVGAITVGLPMSCFSIADSNNINYIIGAGGVLLLGGLLLSYQGYIYHKYGVEYKRGYILSLEYLDQKIKEEKEKLVQLQSDKTKTKLPISGVFEVSNEEQKEVENELKNRMKLGINYNKYYKKYKKGTLLELLVTDKFDEKGIITANNIMKTNGPRLVKKLNN